MNTNQPKNRDMTDWQVGDLAVCVDVRPNLTRGSIPDLIVGGSYRVVGVAQPAKHSLYGITYGLFLAGKTADSRAGSYSSGRFIKVAPDRHEPCEAEFVTLLNRTKQPVFDAIEGKRV